MSFRVLFQWDRYVNIEVPRHLRPAPTGDGDTLGAALRRALSGRFERIPREMMVLLNCL